MYRTLFFLLFSNIYLLNAQIVINNTVPYDNPAWLVDSVLLGPGITATNHVYQGAGAQIGWFNAVNSSLGIDSGIIMCTGDIYSVDPINLGFGVTMPIPPIIDTNLLNVANSVPPLIGQTFTVSSVNDVAILEFDFIPTSDSISFRYVFGSEEYFTYENTQFNDVFAFFLSGPGISGPYENGAINLAIIPNSTPPLPITISSVNNVTPINQQYFVDNSYINFNTVTDLDTIASADGLTTVLTAKALVQCNETYHIRIAIADGSDGILDSYVWLEAGSFSSPILEVVNDLGVDSTTLNIPCNSSITLTADGGPGASYQWFDSTGVVISVDSSINVGPGVYWVEASSFGCPVISDTLRVIGDIPPKFELGLDYIIPCNTTTNLNPLVVGGTMPYDYKWRDIIIDSVIGIDPTILVSGGSYSLQINDVNGCSFLDTIIIAEASIPEVTIYGGGSICNINSNTVDVFFNFEGILPWNLRYYDGENYHVINNILDSNITLKVEESGKYIIDSAYDVNGCVAFNSGLAEVNIYNLPIAIISISDTVIYNGESAILEVGDYNYYQWYRVGEENIISTEKSLNISSSGSYFVIIEDSNSCSDISDTVTINTIPLTELYIPNTFTPNNDENNEVFIIKGRNIVEFKMQIFNRWGESIYKSNSIEKYWDGSFKGKKVIEGSYYYYINVLGLDGKVYETNGAIKVVY